MNDVGLHVLQNYIKNQEPFSSIYIGTTGLGSAGGM